MNICRECKHYSPMGPPDPRVAWEGWKIIGECAKATDKGDPGNFFADGYEATFFCGPDFGCIYWERK